VKQTDNFLFLDKIFSWGLRARNLSESHQRTCGAGGSIKPRVERSGTLGCAFADPQPMKWAAECSAPTSVARSTGLADFI